MRRLLVSVFVASGLVLTGAGAASAEQAPAAGAAQAAAGTKVCKITDERLGELSGLVATEDGFITVNDSSDQDSRKQVFFLDDKCKVVDGVSYGGDGPRDTEDMALSPDGDTLWIADIGDNQRKRSTIGLWSMPVDGSRKPKIHRLAYPAAKHDAEALLMNGDGTPIIVTKEFGRAASIYTPTTELKTGNLEGVPLRKVGEITVPPSDTSGNALSRIGRATIAGGAVSPDGSKVVLRTYTDALEWDVKGGDVVAALKGEPRVTPLPDEPFGEAISYSPDGRNLFTVSDMGDVQDAENFILRYTPVAKAATTKAAAAGGAGGGEGGPSWYDNLTIDDLTYIVGGVGVLGAILVGFGIFGIMQSRKRPLTEPAAKESGAGGPKPADAETELITVGGAASGRGSGVYGGARSPSGSGGYGGKPAPPGGGVYGGTPKGGRPGGVQPPARPGGGAQPAGRPGAAQPARPGAPQPARPGAVQPARPGAPQPARPGGVQPARPGGAQPAGRPGGGGMGQPGGGQQGRPGGGQQGRPGGGQQGRPGGAQPGGRPGQGGGQPGGGVYGAPPQHPQGPGRGSSAGGPVQRPSGFFGQGGGHPEPGRPAPGGADGYADPRSRGRNFDDPNLGRHPYGR